jgi:hypothetical protein
MELKGFKKDEIVVVHGYDTGIYVGRMDKLEGDWAVLNTAMEFGMVAPGKGGVKGIDMNPGGIDNFRVRVAAIYSSKDMDRPDRDNIEKVIRAARMHASGLVVPGAH